MERILFETEDFRWLDFANPQPAESDKISERLGLPKNFFLQEHPSKTLPFTQKLGKGHFVVLRRFELASKRSARHGPQFTRRISVYYDDKNFVTLHRLDSSIFDDFLVENGTALRGGKSSKDLLALLITWVLESFEEPLRDAFQEVDEFEAMALRPSKMRGSTHRVLLARRRASVIKHLLFNTFEIIQRHFPQGESSNATQIELRETITRLIFSADEVLEDFTSTINLQLATASQQTNEVVRVLTMVSLIFMPLSFIAGVYGMNFEHEPEYKWQYGYPWALSLMFLCASSLIVWFYRRGWLRPR